MEPDSDCVVELEPDSDCVVELELDSDSDCVVDEQSNGCMTICPVPPSMLLMNRLAGSSMGAVVKLPAVAAVVAIRVAVPAGAAEFNSAVVAIGEDLLA